jgi:hypothetical protein
MFVYACDVSLFVFQCKGTGIESGLIPIPGVLLNVRNRIKKPKNKPMLKICSVAFGNKIIIVIFKSNLCH